MMMTKYRPDKWVVVKFTRDNLVYYKVLAGWKGGYLEGDSWRLNSGIWDIKEKDHYFHFKGHSGSTYLCHKDRYGFTTQTIGMFNLMSENHNVPLTTVELMPEETDWMELLNGKN